MTIGHETSSMSIHGSGNRKLGLWTSTALVVGNMIGAGVFLMPAAAASFGSISLLGWIFSAIGSFFLAKVFSNLSKLLPGATGGPYAYTRAGLGDFGAFLVGWGYYLATSCANAAIAISFVSALSTFFPPLATNAGAAALTALGTVWLLNWVNSRGVVLSGKVQLITTVLKVLPLLVIGVAGLFFIRAENFHPFNNTHTSLFAAITATATMTMFSFVGIESATVPSGSVNDPGRTVSRATMLGLGITTLIYLLGSVSVMGLIPGDILRHSATPFADAGVILFGSGARYWVSAGVGIAAFGALNGWTLVQSQVPYAIAKDGLFPVLFTRTNSKGVPFVGMIVSGTIISLFILMNYSSGLVEQFRTLLLLSVFTILIPYLFSTAAYLIIRFSGKPLVRKGLMSALVLGILAFVYSLWEIAGAGQASVYHGFLLLMAAVPLYVWREYQKREE
jgi:APA family basic amino acid/polyamine antiporter